MFNSGLFACVCLFLLCDGLLQSSVNVRVVNQLLTEMDGLEARKQVFIMAATNRPGARSSRTQTQSLNLTQGRVDTSPETWIDPRCSVANLITGRFMGVGNVLRVSLYTLITDHAVRLTRLFFRWCWCLSIKRPSSAPHPYPHPQQSPPSTPPPPPNPPQSQ